MPVRKQLNDSQGIPCPYGAKCDFIHKTDVANGQNVQNMWSAGDNTSSASTLMTASDAIEERIIRTFDRLAIGPRVADFATSPIESLAGNQYIQACPALDNLLLGDLNKTTYQNTSNSASAQLNPNSIEAILENGLLTNIVNIGVCAKEGSAPGTPPTTGDYSGSSLFSRATF